MSESEHDGSRMWKDASERDRWVAFFAAEMDGAPGTVPEDIKEKIRHNPRFFAYNLKLIKPEHQELLRKLLPTAADWRRVQRARDRARGDPLR